jgi:hypothetical protein
LNAPQLANRFWIGATSNVRLILGQAVFEFNPNKNIRRQFQIELNELQIDEK